MTARQGAERLFKTCICGIFTVDRATELLEAMTAK
jgi:hypothetical protein